jgi:hypothetical protein
MENRTLKFRAWNPTDKIMGDPFTIGVFCGSYPMADNIDTEGIHYMQYTGLKDKHGSGDICFYECDIVDLHGNLLGNIYEQVNLLENETNLLIEGFGTKNWRSTEEEALARGLGYAQ